MQHRGRARVALRIERVAEAGQGAAAMQAVREEARLPARAQNARAWSVAPPCRGPLKVARPAMTEFRKDAPVEAATRTANAEALSSWSAQGPMRRRIVVAASGTLQA